MDLHLHVRSARLLPCHERERDRVQVCAWPAQRRNDIYLPLSGIVGEEFDHLNMPPEVDRNKVCLLPGATVASVWNVRGCP